MKWTPSGLVEFEQKIFKLFEAGKIDCPIHLSGGNEEQLIDLFGLIKKRDYVFSTHRNHYHYLLKGGDPDVLGKEILGDEEAICFGRARSMNFCDHKLRFYTSAIMAGTPAIACGVALALKHKKSKSHVWCFVGDGVEDEGHFMEAVRFGLSRRLPLTFIIEDNDLSVESTKADRWHNYVPIQSNNIVRYSYERTYPHVGIGKHVQL